MGVGRSPTGSTALVTTEPTGWVCTDATGLRPGSLRARVRGALPLLRLWTHREFTTRYRQTWLAVAWSVLQPAAVLAIYGLVLTGALGVDGDGLPYLSAAWAGLVVWTFFADSVVASLPSISEASYTISRSYFPREVIPLSIVGAGAVELVVQLVLLLGLAIVQGVGLSFHLVALAPVLFVLALWTIAVSVFGAAVAVFVRDTWHAVGLALRLGFFATPVVYTASVFPDRWAWLVDVNPLGVLAEATRDVVLRHEWPAWDLLAAHGVVGAAALWAALAYTRSVEPRMVDLA